MALRWTSFAFIIILRTPERICQHYNGKHFALLDLSGFSVKSALAHIPVQRDTECARHCVTTPGCQAVAILDSTCLPFDGSVVPNAVVVYSVAYKLLETCDYITPLSANMEIKHIYAHPHGYAEVACSRGYIPLTTTITTDSGCTWTGDLPDCRVCHEWQGSCYHFNMGGADWDTALAACRHLGGRLTEILSAEEHDFIVNITEQMPTPKTNSIMSYWIGAYRIPGTVLEYQWTEIGQNVTFRRYSNEDPQPIEEEKCLGLTADDHRWANAPCEWSDLGYICKFALVD